MQIFNVPIRGSKKLFIQLAVAFTFCVLALLVRPHVFAQEWWKSCTSGIYCTGPCNTVWYPPNNCACSAQLCDYYYQCGNQVKDSTCCPISDWQTDAYGTYTGCSTCQTCLVCGGTNVIQGDCPTYYNPCINICTGTSPTPTPTPAPPPLPAFCGNGTCNPLIGETCGNCPVDCGACPTSPPTPTPTPAFLCDPTIWGACSASCGSGIQTNQCGGTRSCCVECGPTPGSWGACTGSPATKTRTVTYNCQANTTETVNCTGTIQARAVEVTSADTSCTAVRASTTAVSPAAIHAFTPGSASQPTPQTQVGASYVTFAGVVGGTYTISPTVPASYVLNFACWSRTLNALTTGEGLTSTLSEPLENETLTWDLGYLLGTPWTQTGGGGNVYATGFLKSLIPPGTSPRVFALSSSGGSPGVVLHGTDFPSPGYDFDPDTVGKGGALVSSTNWIAEDNPSLQVNWYDYFRIKLGGTFPADYTNPLTPIPKPTSRATPYYVSGDMTTSGDWVVGNGETLLFIVNGNLTLGGKVNLVGSGFAAFIVKGNITVDPSVGGLYTSSTPVIEGIYVTSKTGTFQTGTSSVVGKERLVLQGMFMAGSFLLQRDLDSVNANTTTSSELFLYNPRLLFSMPDSLRDVPITWEEVAP